MYAEDLRVLELYLRTSHGGCTREAVVEYYVLHVAMEAAMEIIFYRALPQGPVRVDCAMNLHRLLEPFTFLALLFII